MSSRSQEALARRISLKKAREAAKRKEYRDMQANKQTISLEKKHNISKNTDFNLFETLDFQEINPKGNLTLLHHNMVILQRIAPTSHRKALKAQSSCKEGKILFEKYCRKKQGSSINTSRQAIEHHLGIWHHQGHSSIDFTAETLNHRYKEEGLDLLAWSRRHTNNILLPSRHLIEKEFQDNLRERPAAIAWLSSIFGSKAVGLLLHPWYSTTAFFVNYSGGYHQDPLDCSPSFLFNFDQPAWVELPEFQVRVKLQPLDLLVLNSQAYYHRTVKPADAKGDGRWAFSAFLRRAILENKPISKIASSRLESRAG